MEKRNPLSGLAISLGILFWLYSDILRTLYSPVTSSVSHSCFWLVRP